MSKSAAILATVAIVLASSRAARADELVVSGDLSPGGAITLEMRGTPGKPLVLWAGLGFQDPPLLLKGKNFWVNLSQPYFLLTLGAMPAGGELLLPAALPGDQLLLGLTLNLQSATAAVSNVTSIHVHAPGTTIAPAPAGSAFGMPPLVGDLNGDGFGDYVAGARLENGTGKVYIAYGPNPQPVQTITDPTPQSGSEFGVSLDMGNFVGGPALDLVVGAHGAGPLSADLTGEVWIFEGPAFTSASQLVSPTPAANNGFGIQVVGGDFDGDGFRDIAVGEAGATVGIQPQAGKVQLFHGPSFAPWMTLTRPGVQSAFSLFGAALAAGDIDGDGRDDLVVGVPGAAVLFQQQVGEAWIWYGPLTGSPVLVRDPHPTTGSAFGCRVELANILGDARLDLIVGNPGGAGWPLAPAGIRVGEVEIYDGCVPTAVTEFDDPTPEMTAPGGGIPLGHFGFEVNAADVNGDGHLDLLVGANLADIAGSQDAGELFVYLGPSLHQRFELTSPVLWGQLDFGTFADAVDLDGDGKAELLVCSPGAGALAGSLFVADF